MAGTGRAMQRTVEETQRGAAAVAREAPAGPRAVQEGDYHGAAGHAPQTGLGVLGLGSVLNLPGNYIAEAGSINS